MLDIEDEYIRDYAFDPEFIKRKDSLDTHKERIEKAQKAKKHFKHKLQSIEIHNIIDAEATVNILK